MINPKFEIDRLKRTLIFKGLDEREAQDLGEKAASDISGAISELVMQALTEAIEVGTNLGIEDFATQIRAVNMGSTVAIVTDSGKTDFSYPELHMLPHLLKNAKVAKDGTRYKVIPIKGKKGKPTSSMEVQKDMMQAQQIAREQLNKNKLTGNDSDPLASRQMFSGLQQAKEFIARRQQMKRQETTGAAQEYRTATSKQNPATQWVLPPKDRDMSMVLVDINRKLEYDIQGVVQDIVRQYEELL